METPRTDSDLIKALGGWKSVAALLDIERPSMVWNWENRPQGISADWRPTVASLARRKRIKLPPNFLEPSRRRRNSPAEAAA